MIARDNLFLDNQLRDTAQAIFDEARAIQDHTDRIKRYNDAMIKRFSVNELTDDDLYFLIRCHNNTGTCFNHLNNTSSAINAFIDAIDLWKKIKNPSTEHYRGVIYVHLNFFPLFDHYRGQYHDEADTVEQLVDYCLETLRSLQPHFNNPDHQLTDDERFLLGNLHVFLAEYGTKEDCVENDELHKAIHFLNEINKNHSDYPRVTYLLAFAHHTLGILYQSTNSARESTLHLNVALDYYRQCPTTPNIVNNITMLNSLLYKIKMDSESTYYTKGYTLFDTPETPEEKGQCATQHSQRYSEF